MNTSPPDIASFVINLDSRPDRMTFMQEQLDALGLPFSRIVAVDGLGDADIGYPADHPKLTKPEYACYQSHINALRAFLETGKNYGLVLEDDAFLSRDFLQVISDIDPLVHKLEVLRLETRTDMQQKIARKPAFHMSGRAFHGIRSKAFGSGAYIVTRRTAEHFVRQYSQPATFYDLFLFDPDSMPPSSPDPAMLQCVPAIAIQRGYYKPLAKQYSADSDILPHRKEGQDKVPSKSFFESRRRVFARNMHKIKKLLRRVFLNFRVVPFAN